ncbi:MAG TPA: arylsulfatase [Candidatus Obscuribacterales bacterium]
MATALLLLASCITQPARADRTTIPEPQPEFTGIANRTLDGSIPQWPAPVRAPEGAPNVLLVLVDDAGFGNPSAFGGLTNTPNLEKLAAEGLRYNRFHVTALCSPSRAALLSGRNQHAVGFGSVAEFAGGWPGYNAHWPASAASIAKILRGNGYATACFGKWHLTPAGSFGPAGPFDLWPNALGFTYFWGFLGGETDQFSPLLFENNTILGPPRDKGFYLNTALADHAIDWITQQRSVAPDQPFFVYFSTGSSHAPHQVPKAWADKYKGKFDMGWDKYREVVFKRQKELGVIPPDARLTTRDQVFPTWDSLPANQKALYARQMEVYSGYQENTDHEIGRVIDHIENLGLADNTVIIWIWGDNGASLEGTETGTFNEMTTLNGIPLSPNKQLELIKQYGGLEAWGGRTTEPHYSCAWAWAGNAPFQWGKQIASHLGGTRNPMVIRWPKGIQEKGGLRTQFTHLIDVAPTILEMAHVPPPTTVDGVTQMPMHGVSFAYTFADPKAQERHTQQYFEVFGNRAMYKDGWWLSCRMPRIPWKMDPATLEHFAPGLWNPDKDPVELYNLTTDFSQANNVAAKNPEKVQELQRLFWEDAKKYQVLPLLGGMAVYFGPKFAPPQFARTHFEYLAGTENIPPTVCPQIFKRSYTVSADLDVPDSGAEGVIMANADYLGGYALYVEDKKPRFTYSFMGIRTDTITSSEDLPTGKVNLRYEFLSDKPGAPGAGGTSKLFINGKQVAEGRIEQTMSVLTTSYAGFDIGKDNGLPVSRTYESKLPFAFTGKINKVTFDLGSL